MLFTVACGTGSRSNAPTRETYAYVALSSGNAVGAVAQFKVSNEGALVPLDPPAIGGDGSLRLPGNPLAIDQSGSFLFVAGNSTVSQYLIASDGTLSPNSIRYVPNAPVSPLSVALTGSGLGILSNGKVLGSYRLDSSGGLTPLSTADTTNANSLAIGPSGDFLYAVDEAYNAFDVYAISSDGTISLNGTVPSDLAPYSIVFSPHGFLYSVDYGAGTVTQYSVNDVTGMPTKVQGFSTGSGAGTSQPQGLVFDTSGTHAYVTNFSESTISQFAVDSVSGSLFRNGPDIPTGWAPSSIALDPSGRFIFVGNIEDGTISQFIINEDGSLSSNGVVSAGVNPWNPNNSVSPLSITFVQR